MNGPSMPLPLQWTTAIVALIAFSGCAGEVGGGVQAEDSGQGDTSADARVRDDARDVAESVDARDLPAPFDGAADGDGPDLPTPDAAADGDGPDLPTPDAPADDVSPDEVGDDVGGCTGCQPGSSQEQEQPCGACGGGSQRQSRTCLDDCTWSAWSAWSECDQGACCGDGVVDASVDPGTGWVREECDEGPLNGSGDHGCGLDCRWRRCDEGRACGPLRSTFGAYLPEGPDALRRFFLKMREQGYDEIIVVNTGGQIWLKSAGSYTVVGVEDRYTDTSGGESLLEAFVSMAELARVRVIVGLSGLSFQDDEGADWEVWLNAGRRGPFIAHSLDLAATIDAQVGDSPAFAGFYLPQEMNLGDPGQCTAAGDFYAALIAGAQGRPGLRALAASKQVTVAPYLAVASRTPAQVASNFRCVFDKLEAAGGIDRILVQDGVPKGAEGFTNLGNVGGYFAAMYGALTVSERSVLWVDLETYAWPNGECFLSRPGTIDRIGDQVREIGRWVEGFSQWIHAHNFTAAGLGQDLCDPQRQALGEAYMSRPFPFQAFVYEGFGIVRGYFLRAGGMVRLECDTATGRQTFGFDDANGLAIHYAPPWISDDELPYVGELYEVSFPWPDACVSGSVVTFVGDDGTPSSPIVL